MQNSFQLTKPRFVVELHFMTSDYFFYLKDAEIDSCSWNWFANMAKGSLGVDCPNLEELKAHADMMDKGQKITCKRYLKNWDSMIIYIIDFNL